ncbi:MAG: sodium:proton antiporter [Proteobacteria bacterium]|nr:sodium:proton antiporter [Pseudomonadota bacterium]MBU1686924.1 sodium:proton antiporter [Pseudomonadota bacterium]
MKGKFKRKDWQFATLTSLLIATLVTFLCWAILKEPPGEDLTAEALAPLFVQSGVTSPVTAILLNFRGYDTLLEVMVLFLAGLGIWSQATVDPTNPLVFSSPATHPTKPNFHGPGPELILATLVRILIPLMVLVAGYLTWAGGFQAGGAFQGGALLGGAGILLILAEPQRISTIPPALIRFGIVLGPAIFLLVGVSCFGYGGNFLQYPQPGAGSWLLLIEFGAAISIGITLTTLFVGGRPDPKRLKGTDQP